MCVYSVKSFIAYTVTAIKVFLTMGRRLSLSAIPDLKLWACSKQNGLLDKLQPCLEWHKVPYQDCCNASMPPIQ